MHAPLVESAAATHTGRRANNEDSFACCPELGLFAVADGIGGYEGGEIASRLVADSLAELVARTHRDPDATWPYAADPRRTLSENLLLAGVRFANRRVLERKQGPLSQMGSTVAALLCEDGEAVVCHLGDSRVYRLRDGVLAQLTRDHSLYAELQARGADLPPKEQYPHANVITRALGMADAISPDFWREPLRADDRFMLCSDGLVERLGPDEIAALLADARPARACRQLVDAAYEAGGKDNITCVVVRVR